MIPCSMSSTLFGMYLQTKSKFPIFKILRFPKLIRRPSGVERVRSCPCVLLETTTLAPLPPCPPCPLAPLCPLPPCLPCPLCPIASKMCYIENCGLQLGALPLMSVVLMLLGETHQAAKISPDPFSCFLCCNESILQP